MTGLNDLSISVNCNEIVGIIAVKALIRYSGSFEIFLRMRGTAPRHLQYVSRMVSGFMANAGKLIPIKDPDETTLFTMYLTILEIFDFFY